MGSGAWTRNPPRDSGRDHEILLEEIMIHRQARKVREDFKGFLTCTIYWANRAGASVAFLAVFAVQDLGFERKRFSMHG